MRDTRLINIQRDEYGYSIYWGAHTLLEPGSCHLRDVQRRRVEIIALSRVLTALAEKGENIDHTMTLPYAKLSAACRNAGWYHGRKLANLDAIVETVLKWHAEGLA